MFFHDKLRFFRFRQRRQEVIDARCLGEKYSADYIVPTAKIKKMSKMILPGRGFELEPLRCR